MIFVVTVFFVFLRSSLPSTDTYTRGASSFRSGPRFCRMIFGRAVAAAAAAAAAKCSFGSLDWWWLWHFLHSTSVSGADGPYESLRADCRWSVALMPASLQSVPLVLRIDRCIILDYVYFTYVLYQAYGDVDNAFLWWFLIVFIAIIFFVWTSRIEEDIDPGCCWTRLFYNGDCVLTFLINIVFRCFFV